MSTGVDEVGDAPRAGDEADRGGADVTVRTPLEIEMAGPHTGPIVVLVHGAPDRSGSFRPTIEQLPEMRTARYDRRGYGRSLDVQPAATAMLDHALDLIDVLERCEAPCVVIGHSFGSNPTMLAATLRPDLFLSVGLWEPPICWVDWWPQATKDYHAASAACADPGALIEAMYRRMLGDERWESFPADLQDRRRREGFGFKHDMGMLASAPFAFDDITLPAVVGYGELTSDEHARGAIELVELMPDAQLVAVPDAGHFANRTHPEVFARFVLAAVARAPAHG